MATTGKTQVERSTHYIGFRAEIPLFNKLFSLAQKEGKLISEIVREILRAGTEEPTLPLVDEPTTKVKKHEDKGTGKIHKKRRQRRTDDDEVLIDGEPITDD